MGKHIAGRSDLPGYGVVAWTAEQMILPDGTVYATLLRDATLPSGAPLGEEGRAELVFWESLTA